MKIIVNGEERELDGELSIADALTQWGYARQSVAVALNQDFVPRSAFGVTVVKSGDELEIVAPMQGG